MTWTKPRINFLKLNVDATFHADIQRGAIGAVLQDRHGVFLAAMSRFIPHVSSAAMAEALAMRDGLEMANSRGRVSIEAESDCLEVIQYLSCDSHMWNEAIAIYADSVSLAGLIGTVEFNHYHRVNKVAHEIARSCFESSISCN
jgi:hypothetical protein